MSILITLILLFYIVYKGYWKEWKTYHSTLLYISLCNVFQHMVSGDYHLWEFNHTPFPSHEHADIFMSFISLPAIALLYLSRFFQKDQINQKVKTIVIWTFTSVLITFTLHFITFITYHHGYQFWMEPLFYFTMYLFLPLHHKRPILTYTLSVFIVLFFIFYFNVPIGKN